MEKLQYQNLKREKIGKKENNFYLNQLYTGMIKTGHFKRMIHRGHILLAI